MHVKLDDFPKFWGEIPKNLSNPPPIEHVGVRENLYRRKIMGMLNKALLGDDGG